MVIVYELKGNACYSGTPPYGHPVNTVGHLDNTVTFFCPGETLIHFIIKLPR